MIEEATLNARNAAIKFAQDSNSHLGKIKRLLKDNLASTTEIKTPLISKP